MNTVDIQSYRVHQCLMCEEGGRTIGSTDKPCDNCINDCNRCQFGVNGHMDLESWSRKYHVDMSNFTLAYAEGHLYYALREFGCSRYVANEMCTKYENDPEITTMQDNVYRARRIMEIQYMESVAW